jgi:exodeoxyribonuclease VII small subunit
VSDAALSFEEALARLEEILRRLEHGDVSLDDALDLWRQGDELHRRCLELLTAAEARIEELERPADDNEGGSG